ncbi:MAG: hypothetical protein IT442_05310 [Phycisphaeraceae bacterium]|nr:hypothetical protein [Phycisphaeraceae bacterium]
MEDVRTRRILDELADLFLTGMAPPASSAAPTRERAKPPRAEPATVSGGESSVNGDALRRAMTEQVAGPDVVGHVGSPWMTLEDEFGAEAEGPSNGPALHLADESVDAPHVSQPADGGVIVVPAAEPVSLTVEAVLMGNLPGFAGPWLTQYAQSLTHQDTANPCGVAVLHVGDDQLELEIVYPPGRTSKIPTKGDGGAGMAEQLELLSRSGPVPLRHCLVHLSDAQSERQRRIAQAIGRWTIVSGADAPAVVGAYKLIKQLRQDDPTDGPDVVQLMVMGVDEPDAVEAAERFETTVSNYLGLKAQFVGHVRRMEPVNVHWLGPLAGTAAHWRTLTRQLRELDPMVRQPIGGAAAEPEPVIEPQLESKPVATVTPPVVEEPIPEPVVETPVSDFASEPVVEAVSEPETEPEPAPEPVIEEAPSPPEAVKPAPEAKPEPVKPATAPAMTTESAMPPALATLLPGSVALEARSPSHPEVELALDQEGVIHLLHRLEPGRDAGKAVLDLLAVRRWLSEQWSLIKLTQRQCRFREPAEGGQVVHLVTSEPREAIALAQRLDAAIKVHLLDQVRVGQAVTWYSRALT